MIEDRTRENGGNRAYTTCIRVEKRRDFFATLFLENNSKTSETMFFTKTKDKCQKSVTLEHLQKINKKSRQDIFPFS